MMRITRSLLVPALFGALIVLMLSPSCQKNDPVRLPIPTTLPVTGITCHQALLGGKIVFEVDVEVTAKGFAWCDQTAPDTFDHVVYVDELSNEFYHQLYSLEIGKVYYVRAFVVSEGLLIFGDEQSFQTQPCTGVSFEGHYYPAIQIGNQCWMAENLNVGCIVPGSGNQNNNGMVERYVYGDDTTNAASYGGLYQWNELVAYTAGSDSVPSGVVGIGPLGWHIPSDAEWKELEIALGMSASDADIAGWRGNVGSLIGPGGNSGFEGRYGGDRTNTGFADLGLYGYYWTSTAVGQYDSWHRCIDAASAKINRGIQGKHKGMSVRCVKD